MTTETGDPGLRRLALTTLLAAFGGTTAPAWAHALLRDGLAGYTLFGGNIADDDQLRRLTTSLQATRADALLAIDEEGGDVTRLAHRTGSPYPGNAALGRVDDPGATRRVYQAVGADVAAAGLNLDLAPTVDVNTADDNPVIGTRAFGADPTRVAAHSAAAVHGLQAAGVAACAKHFPGHGATSADSHLTLPTVASDPATLRARDLPPFAAAIDAGTRAVMTAHLRIPALTGDGPATLSRAVLTDLLRHELAFDGAIVTDALEMAGAAEPAGGIPSAAVRALAAGADLLCLGARVDATLVEHVAAAVAAAVADEQLPAARLEDAAARVTALADAVRAPAAPTAPEHAAAHGVAAHGRDLARRAITVDGALPDTATRPLVVQLDAASTIAEGRVPWGITGHLPDVAVLDPEHTSAAQLRHYAGDRPVVLVGRHLHRTPHARTVADELSAAHPTIVVEMGWPGSWRPAGARGFVTTYGATAAAGAALADALHPG